MKYSIITYVKINKFAEGLLKLDHFTCFGHIFTLNTVLYPVISITDVCFLRDQRNRLVLVDFTKTIVIFLSDKMNLFLIIVRNLFTHVFFFNNILYLFLVNHVINIT